MYLLPAGCCKLQLPVCRHGAVAHADGQSLARSAQTPAVSNLGVAVHVHMRAPLEKNMLKQAGIVGTCCNILCPMSLVWPSSWSS